MKQRWNKDLNTFINDEQWSLIFKISFKTVYDNSLLWFQLKILYRILGTNKYLYKIGLSESPVCRRCNELPESIVHLFAQCKDARTFWNLLENLIFDKTNFRINFNDFNIIHGYLFADQNNVPLNTIIITAKKLIFECVKSKGPLHILAFKHKLAETYKEQLLVSKINAKESNFNRIWHKWLPVFEN